MQRSTYIVGVLCAVFILCSGGGIYLFLQQESLPTQSRKTGDRPARTSQGSGTTEAPSVPEASVQISETAAIVFAADFGNNSGCETHNQGGCDIYTANIQLDGTVLDVERRTDNAFEEVFPVFSPDGSMIYANTSAEKFGIEWIDLSRETSGILQSSARGPVPLPDGKRMIFSSLGKSKALMIADLTSPTSLSNIEQISPEGASYGEPHGAPNGDVIFSKLFGAGRGSNTAQAGVYRLATEEFIDLTEQDGTAHCFWGFGGTSAYCNNAEKFRGIFRIPFTDGVVGTATEGIVPPKLADVLAQDDEYTGCRSVFYAYGTFCDEDHAIVTMGCENTDAAGDLTLSVSKLALIDLSTSPVTMYPLGKNLADTFGGVGDSSYTVSCRME